MFGSKINFGIMLRPQHIYNKFYAKHYYWKVKNNNISIKPKLKLVTTYSQKKKKISNNLPNLICCEIIVKKL